MAQKTILVTGALGQIGSELVPELRRRYGDERVVASDIRMPPVKPRRTRPRSTTGRSSSSTAPTSTCCRRWCGGIDVGTIYHLAALLSATSESKPHVAWDLNMGGLYRVLEVARAEPLRGLLPQLDRRLRPRHAARPHAAGHRPAADHHVRRHQGGGRAALRLLLPALRRRHPRLALPRPDLLRRAARRRHHRLRGRDLLRGASATGTTPASWGPTPAST